MGYNPLNEFENIPFTILIIENDILLK